MLVCSAAYRLLQLQSIEIKYCRPHRTTKLVAPSKNPKTKLSLLSKFLTKKGKNEKKNCLPFSQLVKHLRGGDQRRSLHLRSRHFTVSAKPSFQLHACHSLVNGVGVSAGLFFPGSPSSPPPREFNRPRGDVNVTPSGSRHRMPAGAVAGLRLPEGWR